VWEGTPGPRGQSRKNWICYPACNKPVTTHLKEILVILSTAPRKENKRRIMRIFTLPPAAETPPEPNFYDSMKKIRLRQQLEMYSIGNEAAAVLLS
uniref:Small integral membrane protein 19 n=1 Tax=Zosterops lateralis melanops TaxID=1220523 RepID=A0A8D2NPP2_ZOSLA